MLVLVALVILLASIAAGYALWVRPFEAQLDSRSKALLVFVILTLFGALWGSGPWWFDENESFAWNLPPLASRMLGAAGIAFVVAGLFALTGHAYQRLRLMLVMVAVYMLPLAVAIVAFHLDYFDFDEPVVWGFFPLVVIMCTSVVYLLAQTPQTGLVQPPEGSLPLLVRAWLGAVAAITLAWGLALFATDDGGSKDIWAWPGDLLASRLIAVMLLTLAACAIWALVYPSTAAMALAVIATYGLVGALANVWQDFLDKPVKEGYVIVLGAIGAISLVLLAWRLLPETGSARRAVGG